MKAPTTAAPRPRVRRRITAGPGIHPAVVCAWRSVPVRLVARGGGARRGDHDGQGRPYPALPQPDVPGPRLSARDAGGCLTRTSAPSACSADVPARHLRQHGDGGRSRVRRQDRRFNRRFLAMCSHYLVEPTACTPAAGWEKGRSRTRSARASTCSRRGCTLPTTPSSTPGWRRCLAQALARHPEQTDRTVWEVLQAEQPVNPLLRPVRRLPQSRSRCRRAAWCALTTTATARSRRRGVPHSCAFTPSASSSAATARSSANTAAASVAPNRLRSLALPAGAGQEARCA